MEKINNDYIKNKYDIEKERQNKTSIIYMGELNIEQSKFTKEEFLKMIERNLNNYKEDIAYIEPTWNYEGVEISVFGSREEPETDREVIERLKKLERKERKLAKDIEKAKELLRSVGEL